MSLSPSRRIKSKHIWLDNRVTWITVSKHWREQYDGYSHHQRRVNNLTSSSPWFSSSTSSTKELLGQVTVIFLQHQNTDSLNKTMWKLKATIYTTKYALAPPIFHIFMYVCCRVLYIPQHKDETIRSLLHFSVISRVNRYSFSFNHAKQTVQLILSGIIPRLTFVRLPLSYSLAFNQWQWLANFNLFNFSAYILPASVKLIWLYTEGCRICQILY